MCHCKMTTHGDAYWMHRWIVLLCIIWLRFSDGCKSTGESCGWLPEGHCCENHFCINDVCTKCKLLTETCLNSNECCNGACWKQKCTPFEEVRKELKNQT
ncbi:hypothetical protein FGIG_07251 [Fasciola gigantica]|uniref:Uncharacterized protein n=1 Tax=Fasciola gigantica TaxID=46835 RepID=A0A504Z1N0_FASGI|nr:hypothetical protein FGIG_07251 [Fasciola gigantica]